MGLGFVLFGWTLICGVVAVPIAAGLGAWSWRAGRKSGALSRRRVVAAAIFPFLLIAFGLFYFVAYAVYSYAARHVDPGIGDGWQVPLGGGYDLCMIDEPDEGYVMKGDCSGSPPIDAITQLGQQEGRVVGVSRRRGPFIFSLVSGELTSYPTLPEALRQFATTPTVTPTNAFYISRRWGWQDAVAAAMLVASIAALALAWFHWFIRPPSTARNTVA